MVGWISAGGKRLGGFQRVDFGLGGFQMGGFRRVDFDQVDIGGWISAVSPVSSQIIHKILVSFKIKN